jgi:hypothetical protein
LASSDSATEGGVSVICHENRLGTSSQVSWTS